MKPVTGELSRSSECHVRSPSRSGVAANASTPPFGDGLLANTRARYSSWSGCHATGSLSAIDPIVDETQEASWPTTVPASCHCDEGTVVGTPGGAWPETCGF